MGIDTSYVVARAKGSQSRTVCPACGPMRKSKNDPTLSIHTTPDGIVVWKCWHCGETGRTGGESVVTHVAPIRKIESEAITNKGLAYLAERGISQETAELLGIVSGSKWFRKSNAEKEAIGFIYTHQSRPYACKWRCVEAKDFTQDGSAGTLYLADNLTNHSRVIITEGELDAVSFWEAGIEAVSIPSGAISPASNDDAARLRWIQAHDDLLAKAESIYLAVDMDGPGQTTANELARRLGKTKCFKVEFPDGCKDANDTLLKLGKEGLAKVIQDSQPWPVEGISQPVSFYNKVVDLYQKGLPAGLSTGWPTVDDHFTINPGNLVVLTGIPGHGKSTFLDAMLMNAMKQHGVSVAYASFENPPEIHLSKLMALYHDKPFGAGPTPRLTKEELEAAFSWINPRVSFLTHDGIMPTVESLIERFETAVRRMGVKVCVVDPFNFMKLGNKDGMDTEAINEMLSKFKMFAQRCEVTFFLVAHPAKPMMVSKDWVPTGYSISGSAHFYNRADFGLTMHRDGSSWLHVWKCRFAHQGKVGKVELIYQKPTGNFLEPYQPQPGSAAWLDEV